MLAEMSDKKRKMLESFDENAPVDEMPDCEKKFAKILQEAQGGKKFVDTQFKGDESSLGPGCMNRGVNKWVRASDKPGVVLFKDKINHEDVV